MPGLVGTPASKSKKIGLSTDGWNVGRKYEGDLKGCSLCEKRKEGSKSILRILEDKGQGGFTGGWNAGGGVKSR